MWTVKNKARTGVLGEAVRTRVKLIHWGQQVSEAGSHMDITSLSSVPVTPQTTGSSAGRTAANGVSGAAAVANVPDTSRIAPTYISPALSYDPSTHLVITQYRDTETGKVRLQIPAEKVVETYRRIAAYGAAAVPNAAGITGPIPGTPGTTGSSGTATTTTGVPGSVPASGGIKPPWAATSNGQNTTTVTGLAVKAATFDSTAALMASLPPTALANQVAQATLNAAASSVAASLPHKVTGAVSTAAS